MSDEGKLFVGGLSFDTNEESLSNAFSKFGSIQKVDVIRDKDTGRSRGFGFVKFDNAEDAKDALEGMSGKSLDGREIRVDEAGKSGRKGGSQTGSRGGGSRFGRSWGARGSRGYQRDFEGGSGYYSGERGYRDRSYGDRNFGGGERSGGSGGNGGYRSGGYSNSYRDNRGQGGYDRASSYREGYDSYASQE